MSIVIFFKKSLKQQFSQTASCWIGLSFCQGEKQDPRKAAAAFRGRILYFY